LSGARSVVASDVRRSQLWRLPMRSVASPLSLVPRTSRISHTTRLILRPPRKLRGGHPSTCSLERTQCVLVEFCTSLERGEQDLQLNPIAFRHRELTLPAQDTRQPYMPPPVQTVRRSRISSSALTSRESTFLFAAGVSG
jgi:hypothetical protein